MILRRWYEHLKQKPCAVCGNYGVEIAHIRAVASEKVRHDMMPRRKDLSQFAAIPLCTEHHRTGEKSIHAMGEHQFFKHWFGGPAYPFSLLIRYLVEFINAV